MNNRKQEIREHLIKTREEFNNHLLGEKIRFLFELALQTPERREKVQKILTWINQALGDEVLDEGGQNELEKYKILYSKWNEDQTVYNGRLDFGGSLLTLKELLDKWENPPKPALNDNEKKIIELFPQVVTGSSTSIGARLERAKNFLTTLEKNDLTAKANPNLLIGNINFAEYLANCLKEIIYICEFYFQAVEDLEQDIRELEERIRELGG